MNYLDSLLYIFDHDLKSSIDDIDFFVNTLKNNFTFDENKKSLEVFHLIEKSVEKQRSIIDGLADFIILKKRQKYIPTTFNPLYEIKKFFSQEMNDDIIIIKDNELNIKGSKGLFLILIKNLVSNALKYNDKLDKKIFIYKEDDCIVINDNGNGLDVNKIDEFYKPFTRGNHSNVYGTGLGLAIVKEITNIYNWEITVQSKINVGTTFKINIYANLFN